MEVARSVLAYSFDGVVSSRAFWSAIQWSTSARKWHDPPTESISTHESEMVLDIAGAWHRPGKPRRDFRYLRRATRAILGIIPDIAVWH
jgi:hypothetical protein